MSAVMSRRRLQILLLAFSLLTLSSALAMYFTRESPMEEERFITLCNYEHIGGYNYTAELGPNVLYNKTTLRPGEGRLYTEMVQNLSIAFQYIFTCDHRANVTCNYSVGMDLESASNWTKHFAIAPWRTMKSTGNANYSVSAQVNLTWFKELIDVIGKETGATATEYILKITPRTHITADTDFGPIDEWFLPTMEVRFSYRTLEGDYISIEGLEHWKPGKIGRTEVVQQEGSPVRRYASYAAFATSLTALLLTIRALVRMRRPEKPPVEDMIKPYREIIAGVSGKPSYRRNRTVIEMRSLDDLVKVSDELRKPILLEEKPASSPEEKPTHLFYVLDGLVRYEYTARPPQG